jgi:hypothetical protein
MNVRNTEHPHIDLTELNQAEDYINTAQLPIILIEGTRRLRESDRALLVRIGRFLAARWQNAIFRTGNAEGADSAFAEGVRSVANDRLQYVLPGPRMGRNRLAQDAWVRHIEELSEDGRAPIIEATKRATPDSRRPVDAFCGLLANRRLAAIGSYLLRDTLKVLGSAELGLAPATLGIFYSDDPDKGGTGHTIRVCHEHGVPVVLQNWWQHWLGEGGER